MLGQVCSGEDEMFQPHSLRLWGCYKDVELWLEFDNACNNES